MCVCVHACARICLCVCAPACACVHTCVVLLNGVGSIPLCMYMYCMSTPCLYVGADIHARQTGNMGAVCRASRLSVVSQARLHTPGDHVR